MTGTELTATRRGPAISFVPIATLLLAAPAIARPPPGANLHSPEHAWWECHLQPVTKQICCEDADGHALGDNEWRTAQKSDATWVYQVRVGQKWFEVPQQVIVNDMRRCGTEPDPVKRSLAKVWYYPIWDTNGLLIDVKIRCFIVGTMY